MATKRFTVDAVFRGINKISKPARSMGRSISKFVKKSNRQIAQLGRNFKKLGAGMGKAVKRGATIAGLGVAGLSAAVFGLVSQFSKLEDAEAMFTPLLGSTKKAKKLVDELNKTAASTPFQFENLAGVAGQLLPVMNGDIENTIKTLRMLGDTAGGNAQKLETITRGFTKAMLKGKVDLESLNMIAEAGVPIFGDLAKVMGTKVGEKFFKSISKGEVTTDQLTKAFENMTKKGGIFFKGMEVASKTTTGVISTMKDNISLAAASFGKLLAPTVKKYASKTTEAAKAIKGWIKANEELIASKINTFLNILISSFNTIISVGKKVFSVLSTVARELFPPFKKLFDAFMNAASSLFPQFTTETNFFQKALNAVLNTLEFLANVGVKAFEFIAFASPFLKPFIATLLIFKGVLIAIALVTKGWAIAQGILNAIMAVNPITLIIIAIAALVAGIVLLIQNWDVVVLVFKTGINNIAFFFNDLWSKISSDFAKAGEMINVWWAGVTSVFSSGIKLIWGWFTDLLNNPFITGIVSKITNVWDSIISIAKTAIDKIWGFFAKLLDNPFFKAAGAIMGKIFGFVPEIIKNVTNKVKNVTSSVTKTVKRLFKKTKSFFSSIFKRDIKTPELKIVPKIEPAKIDKTTADIKTNLKLLPKIEDSEGEVARPITPAERLSRAIEENTTRSIEQTENNSTLTIKDQTGRAQLEQQKKGPQIQLETSGAA